MAESPRNARGVAYDLLRAVEVDGAYANLLMPKLLDKARLDSCLLYTSDAADE